MSSLFIFCFGILVTLLCMAFLFVTLREMPRADSTKHLLVDVPEEEPKKQSPGGAWGRERPELRWKIDSSLN